MFSRELHEIVFKPKVRPMRSPMMHRIERSERAAFADVVVDAIALIVIIVGLIWLLASPAPARGDDWTKADTAWQSAAVAMIAVDWMQTSSFEEGGFYESNPILGTYPSQRRINLTIGTTMLAHVVIARILPQPYRRGFQAITITLELGATTNNALNGAGVSLPW